MSVLRQQNWLGQQRIDVPHLRAVESSIAADFDLLAGQILAGSQPLVVKGFNVLTTGAVGNPATSLVLNTAGGIILHPTANEAGTIFGVSENQLSELLNSTNSKLDGNFTPNTTNYIGLNLKREADPETSDLVAFLDANTLEESIKTVPLARTLGYRIIVTTTDFSILPNVLPIAKVVTNSNNIVVSIEDARPMLFRLAQGGSIPNSQSSYIWNSRRENASGDVFAGGDKDLSSLKNFADAVMTRLWELGGGEYWYRPTSDRDIKLTFGNPTLPSNSDNFAWTLATQTLEWDGLGITFANSLATYNTIAAGSATLTDGQCLYVDVNRSTNAAILTAQVGTLSTLGSPVIPGSRHIIAWRLGSNVFIKDKAFEIGRTVPVASTTVLGTVKLAYAAGSPTAPVVAPVGANGTISATATGSNANGFVGTGFGSGYGVQGTGGSTGAGVRGKGGATGRGVVGEGGDSGGIGVLGTGTVNNEGVRGEGQGTGAGVTGKGGATGRGVVGEGGTSGGIGVVGVGTVNNAGVRGEGQGTGAGVIGIGGSSSGAAGVRGESSVSNGYGGYFSNATGTALYANGNAIVSGKVQVESSVNGINIWGGSNSDGTNIAIGDVVLEGNTTGIQNTGIGMLTLTSNGAGSSNTAVGCLSLNQNTNGSNNTAIGDSALRFNTTGTNNTAVGQLALNSNTTATNNTAIGQRALRLNTTGGFNTGVGSFALAANTTGTQNTAVGHQSLTSNTTGGANTAIGQNCLYSNTTGTQNTAVGVGALTANTTGNENTAIGRSALVTNTAGTANTAVGLQALQYNTTGNGNTATGYQALVSNTTGNTNNAIGYGSLFNNTTGSGNSAMGYQALLSNTTGASNLAAGGWALKQNTTGSDNTAVGASALQNNTTGNQNTGIGEFSLSNNTTYSNCTGVGYNAQVTADNQVQLGNSLTRAWAYGALLDRSDKRDKADIQDTKLGLEFIKQLRPVDYRWDYREDYKEIIETEVVEKDENGVERTKIERKVVEKPKDGSQKRTRFHHGFIAQEVKSVMDNMNTDFGGYIDHSVKGGEDVLSLGYTELIAPLVKAIQELAEENKRLKERILALEEKSKE